MKDCGQSFSLNSIGLYVIMFLQILSTVIRVALIFSILFIGFGFTFRILTANSVCKSISFPNAKHPFQPFILAGLSPRALQEDSMYPTAFLTIVDAVVMMMGDLNFMHTFAIPYTTGHLHYPSLNFIFLILFILLMPILFINLLIGLAVGDIELVLKNARLKRLAMQVRGKGLEAKCDALLTGELSYGTGRALDSPLCSTKNRSQGVYRLSEQTLLE